MQGWPLEQRNRESLRKRNVSKIAKSQPLYIYIYSQGHPIVTLQWTLSRLAFKFAFK
jgi:hypothetical protein